MDMGDVLIIIITAMNKDRLDELYGLYPLSTSREYRKSYDLKKMSILSFGTFQKYFKNVMFIFIYLSKYQIKHKERV